MNDMAPRERFERWPRSGPYIMSNTSVQDVLLVILRESNYQDVISELCKRIFHSPSPSVIIPSDQGGAWCDGLLWFRGIWSSLRAGIPTKPESTSAVAFRFGRLSRPSICTKVQSGLSAYPSALVFKLLLGILSLFSFLFFIEANRSTTTVFLTWSGNPNLFGTCEQDWEAQNNGFCHPAPVSKVSPLVGKWRSPIVNGQFRTKPKVSCTICAYSSGSYSDYYSCRKRAWPSSWVRRLPQRPHPFGENQMCRSCMWAWRGCRHMPPMLHPRQRILST